MNYHVVAVDDEQIALDGLSHLDWESHGFELTATLSSGSSALQWLQRNPCDLLIADIRMPGISGLELVAKVKETQPDIMIMLLSGHSEFEYAQEALRHGVFRYLLKPIDDEEIATVLAEAKQLMDKRERQRHWTQKIVRDYWFRDHLRRRYDPENFEQLGTHYFPNEQIGPHRVIYVVGDGDQARTEPLASRLYHSTYLRDREWACVVLEKDIPAVTEATPTTADYVGVSGVKTSLHDMRTALSEARRAAEDWFKRPSERVYRYAPDPPDLETRLHRSLNQAAEFADRIATLHVEDPVDETAGFLRDLQHCPFDAASVRRIAYTVALGIQRLLSRFAASGDAPSPEVLPDPFAIIEHAQHLPEIIRELSHAVERAVDYVQSTKARQLEDERLAAVLSFIHEHFREPISLEHVAAEAGMHPARFSSWFKHTQGSNYIDYLTRLRVDTAKTLLRSPRTRVKDVARESGFQDPRYFGQVFKKLVGITPTRYQFLHSHDEAATEHPTTE